MAAKRAIGFWRGFSAPFGALRMLATLPRAWPFALVPAAVFMLLEAGFVAASWHLLRPWVSEHLAEVCDLCTDIAQPAAYIAVALAGLLGWLFALLLAPTLSSPALERVVGITEASLLLPARAKLGFVAEFSCGLRSFLFSSAVTLPLIVGLTLLEMFAPPLAVVLTPLKLLIGALGVAWGLFDYPLTLRGIGARERARFMRRHLSVVVGFGGAFSLISAMPCCGFAMLPVGVVAATRLYWEIEGVQ